jgi:tRNA (guanine10-N2)-dimethyltransferase
MEVALVLSKEHHTLPLAEVEAVLDAEGMNYLVKKDKEGLLLLDLPDDHSESLIKITKRLSFTHELFKVLI